MKNVGYPASLARRLGAMLYDALLLLAWHGQFGDTPPCVDAADADDNGRISLLDPLLLLRYVFQDGDAPPVPGLEECGPDPTDDDLDCLDLGDACE